MNTHWNAAFVGPKCCRIGVIRTPDISSHLVKRTRVLATAAVAALVVVGAGYAYHISEHPRFTYASYADAIRDGDGRRGWLPLWVPPSAHDLEAVHDLDTNRRWLRFALLAGDTAAILAASAPLSVQTARQTGADAPRMPEWPMELGRVLLATPRSSIRLGRIPPPTPNRASDCILLDRRTLVIYVWSC